MMKLLRKKVVSDQLSVISFSVYCMVSEV